MTKYNFGTLDVKVYEKEPGYGAKILRVYVGQKLVGFFRWQEWPGQDFFQWILYPTNDNIEATGLLTVEKATEYALKREGYMK